MKKRFLTVITLMLVTITCAISASALGLQHVTLEDGLITNSIDAGFMESQKGGGSYGTDTSKVIKQSYVRLQEGSFDSGRVYSDVGAQYDGQRYLWARTSKANNVLYNCYTYYGWLYY